MNNIPNSKSSAKAVINRYEITIIVTLKKKYLKKVILLSEKLLFI